MKLKCDTSKTGDKSKRFLANWKSVNREMARQNARYGPDMVEIPFEDWPENVKNYTGPLKPIGAWRSNRFFAQITQEENGAIRISIQRTQIDETYNFVDGITWDELFIIKNQIGFADKDCIEIYPAESKLVNVAHIRHLFVLDQPHPYNWRK